MWGNTRDKSSMGDLELPPRAKEESIKVAAMAWVWDGVEVLGTGDVLLVL